MSQENVRKILKSLGGEASTSEIAEDARRAYPDRTLHTYVGDLLKRLQEKGFVERTDKMWKLTPQGEQTSIKGTPIDEIDSVVSESDLRDAGLSVSNIVVTLTLEQGLDLVFLSNAMRNTEYHPEQSPYLIFRPPNLGSATLLIPTNGNISIVGAKSKSEVIGGIQALIGEFAEAGVDIDANPASAIVQNTVLTGSLHIELELSNIAVGLGLERTEYNPERFAGVVYRLSNGSTVIMYRTGSYLITGSKSYAQVLEANEQFRESLKNIGVEI